MESVLLCLTKLCFEIENFCSILNVTRNNNSNNHHLRLSHIFFFLPEFQIPVNKLPTFFHLHSGFCPYARNKFAQVFPHLKKAKPDVL